MNDFYREHILDHYRNPHNFGHLPKPQYSLSDHNVSCGDTITIEILLKKGIIKDIAFSGEGCAISTASASLLTDHARGKSYKQVVMITTEELLQLLGISLTPTRLKCALLPLEVLQKMLSKVK